MPFVGAKAEVVGAKGPTPFVRASQTSGQAVVPGKNQNRINSGAKLFYDVTSFLPASPFSACFSPTLTINSHIRTMWVSTQDTSAA
jgi:hypothetical protein